MTSDGEYWEKSPSYSCVFFSPHSSLLSSLIIKFQLAGWGPLANIVIGVFRSVTVRRNCLVIFVFLR